MMKPVELTLLPSEERFVVESGKTLLEALRDVGALPEAPCGGMGKCGKCRVSADGQDVLACQVKLEHSMTVALFSAETTVGTAKNVGKLDSTGPFALAVDLGTTTIVVYLLDSVTGRLLAEVSAGNPQRAYGADVLSRIQYVLEQQTSQLRDCVQKTLQDLTVQAAQQAGIGAEEIETVVIAGNTAMHHLLLGIDPRPLTVPPYMPGVTGAIDVQGAAFLPVKKRGTVRILPNIAGFVGGDTVACMVAANFANLEQPTLLIDIGTNGEMVLGDWHRRLTCSAAAGPAFEGANISCGMRGTVGAIDHVWVERGGLRWHVIGEGVPVGLCGSGLLDLVASLLKVGAIDGSGKMRCGSSYCLPGTAVVLTQRDVREVQLAKAAIRTGIELMADRLVLPLQKIQRVLLAGAFGSCLDPRSACSIGMIPAELLERIESIGHAVGRGATYCALSEEAFESGVKLAKETEFVELASDPMFQDRFVDALAFREDDTDD